MVSDPIEYMKKIGKPKSQMRFVLSLAYDRACTLSAFANDIDKTVWRKPCYQQNIGMRRFNKELFGIQDGHTWYFANRTTQFYDVIPQLVSRVLDEQT